MALHPLTVAERTGFRETSRHADVLRFIDELQARSCRFRVESMGTTPGGRAMPVLVSGERRPERPVVLVLANIHAGEVEGKEAVLALARDLPDRVLEGLTLLLVPNYNPDGNDLIDPKNRALDLAKLEGQIGPEGGVGTRYTGTGINLNRDYIKQEAMESRHLSRLYGAWRPHLTVDCHTTDGSIHDFALTYDTSHIPTPPCEWIRTVFLPETSRRLRARTSLKTFFYGNFVDEKDPGKGWRTYSHLPRYGSHYRGLTGRMDILLESYSYIPFRERFVVTVEILKDIFDLALERSADILRLCRDAEAWRPDPVGVAYGEPASLGDAEIHAWDLESQVARRIPGREPKIWRVPHLAAFAPTALVRRPWAWRVPADQRSAVASLRLHHIHLDEVTGVSEVEAEVYRIETISGVESPDCGSHTRHEAVLAVRGPDNTRVRLEKGDVLVRSDQPLGTLAAYLLEPASDDGLARWGLVEGLRPGGAYPIARIPRPIP
ncbi:MAG TPA: M14 family metallopeptidase [Planctomycetota bacterium]|nr:M14 family metallopeptidase [Planctomycetota bacterium]